MDGHTLSETGNVLSIIGILVSALGVLVSVLYARSAKKTAITALQAAAAARRALLVRVATEEFIELLQQLRSLRQAIITSDFARATELAEGLSVALASAQTAWKELPELQHEEVAVASRDVKRILALLRDHALLDNERIKRLIEILDFVNYSVGKVSGRLRFRS